jgi:formylglycine-generating enzyme required for sulfatase activity
MAEVLAGRGNAGAHGLLDGFFAESAGFNLHTTENMIRVDAFLIDKYLVTNREFECMVPAHAKRRDKYSDQDDQPVIYVTWFEAMLFCRWRGPGFRLPTEEEWYKAAAWDPKQNRYRKYPWGDEFDAEKCNTSEKGLGRTTPVGAYPDGASAYGCYDMAGNVWEWTATETELSWAKGEKGAVLRGGAWDSDQGYAASAIRFDYRPHGRNGLVGFRCARTDD